MVRFEKKIFLSIIIINFISDGAAFSDVSYWGTSDIFDAYDPCCAFSSDASQTAAFGTTGV